MSWPIVIPARLEAGVLKLNAKRLAALLKGRRDCPVEIVIERKHATRSLPQNSYYWGVVLPRLHAHLIETGNTLDDLHDICKCKFLPKSLALTKKNGEIVGEFVIGGSTTKLNKIEFGEYIERIRDWALTLGCEIPLPVEPNSEAA